MQAPIEVQKQLVRDRIAQSIDVSGAFDNCFYHCYAAHLIANKLPLPDDLFSFDSISGVQSPAHQLQELLPSAEALDIFAEYDHYKDPAVDSDKNYVVEKTLVLGFLLREWFATKLATDKHQMNEMLPDENGIITTFKQYKSFRAFMDKQALISGPEGTKYIPNEAFLEYFAARRGPLADEELAKLSSQDKQFEQYFIDAGDDDGAIATYWQAEGYQNYCKYLAKPAVKLTPADTFPVLAALEQSFTVYNNDGSVQTSFDGSDEDFPRLEVSIEVLAGHYHLLTTEKTTDYLREYTTRFSEYKDERAAVLRISSLQAKRSRAEQSSCPLVASICCEHLSQQPFQSLIGKIKYMQQFVTVSKQLDSAFEQVEVQQRVSAELEQLEKEHLRLEQEHQELERQKHELLRVETFQREKTKLQNEFLTNLRQLLPHIQPESKIIYTNLHTAQRELFSKLSINADRTEVEHALRHFSRSCKQHIESASNLMDYGWLYRMTEILVKGVLALFVGSAMIIGAVAGEGILNAEHRKKYKDTFFTLGRSNGCLALGAFSQQVSGLKRDIKELQSEAEKTAILSF